MSGVATETTLPPVKDMVRKNSRLAVLDALRGLIMVIMALDHANKFIAHSDFGLEIWGGSYANYDGDGLAFLTRLVTHLSAPAFFFLMGVGMFLFAQSRRNKGWGEWQIAGHFALRGSLLILLQLLVENPAWDIGSTPSTWTYWGVLFALGGTMILGVIFLRIPHLPLVIISIGLIVATELSLPSTGTAFNPPQPDALRLWLIPGFSEGIFVLYPIMPWLGVLGLGIAFGDWLKQDRQQALQATLPLGVGLLIAFVVIRAYDNFGNIRPMIGGDWIAFLNVVKYPPAITFLTLTMGVNLLMLYALWRFQARIQLLISVLTVYGQVPLFFYILHLYLYGYMADILDLNTNIGGMYPYWLLGLLLLYPLCLVYGKFKHSRPSNSLWRFL